MFLNHSSQFKMNKLQVQIFLTILSIVSLSSGYKLESGVNRIPISLKQCIKTTNLFDSDRNYLKSVCTSNTAKNYNEAENFCLDNGMDLLIVENQAVYDEVTKFVLLQWPNIEVWSDVSGLWFNGRFINNEWIAFKNLKNQPIGKGMKIVNEKQNSGNCAVMKRNYNVFELRNYDCTEDYIFLCEYQSTL